MSGGGYYNCGVANYSPDTCKLLKVLLEESKLSISTQRKINSAFLTGSPLPKPRARSAPQHNNNLFDLKKNYHFNKRSESQIKNSGAYEVDQIRCLRPSVDRSKAKEDLQNVMAFGNRLGERKKEKIAQLPKILTRQDRLSELMNEIQDRIEFLECMKQLGQYKKYERDVKQEISAKLRDLREVERMTDFQFTSSEKTRTFSKTK